MSPEILFILVVFAAVYLGMALGRWPGLRLDRTGIALLGAIALVVTGQMAPDAALAAIDLPTLLILFGLMILSAQFASCGFYDWCSAKIATSARSPAATLAATVAVSGGLSAVLANDVVVFAMTPMLIAGVRGRGLDPRPFLIALAAGANAGSAATLIGNPQNILIGQVGGRLGGADGTLDFWRYLAMAGPAALLALLIVFAIVYWLWRDRLIVAPAAAPMDAPLPVARAGLAKAVFFTLLLLVLFATPLAQAASVLIVAGALMVSRRLASRDMLRHVDWHLLVLFAGLFVVTGAFAATGLAGGLLERLVAAGWSLEDWTFLAPVALAGSNVIGNVPAVILILAVAPELSPQALTLLAVLSTLAGNLLIVGSLANIIVVERARDAGVTLGFVEHAKCGIPITLASMAAAILWLSLFS